jgi:hypothetical protein
MNMPTFLIIGAPRCATHMLYQELARHPDIFMSPNKEPFFFGIEGRDCAILRPGDYPIVRDLQSYQSLFSAARPGQAIGEASPLYLYSPLAALRIKYHVPDVKLIAVLRNPADRAYSHFCLHRMLSVEEIADFRQAIEAEDERAQVGFSPNWYYRRVGLYGEQLARYFSLFSREQMKLFLFEDLEQNGKKLIQDIVDFLGLKTEFQVRVPPRVNPAGQIKDERLHAFLTQPNFITTLLKPFLSEEIRLRLRSKIWNRATSRMRHSNLAKRPLDPQVRQWLIGFYRADIMCAQEILGRDLSHWLSD